MYDCGEKTGILGWQTKEEALTDGKRVLRKRRRRSFSRKKPLCARFSRQNGILSTANPQYRKCANALLASAILWVSSFFLNAPPVLFLASMISAAKRSAMVFSPLERE